MADTKTSALTAATSLDGTELLPIVQSSSSKKATAALLVSAAASPVLGCAVGGWLIDPAQSGTANLSQSEAELSVIARFLPAATYDIVAVNVATAGSTGAVFKIVFYANVDGVPGAQIGVSSDIAATTTGVKQVTLTASLVVPTTGIVWGGVVIQGGATTRPVFTRVSTTNINNRLASAPTDFTSASVPNYYTSSVSGTPPNPWAATTRFDSSPRMAYHRSA